MILDKQVTMGNVLENRGWEVALPISIEQKTFRDKYKVALNDTLIHA